MLIGGIVQARMSSTRLPGKVLREIKGKPLIQFLLESLRHCNRLDDVLVATSSDASDDAIEGFCKQFGVECHRGSLTDVASRFDEVVQKYPWDAFVRVSGDSPLLDHRIVDQAIDLALRTEFDVVTNVHPRTFPRGQSVEVVSVTSFRTALPQMRSSEDREHVTKYFYGHTDKFKVVNFSANDEYSGMEMAVDTEDDSARVNALLAKLQRPHWTYSLDSLVSFYRNTCDFHKKAA